MRLTPRQMARYRERQGSSGAKSDAGDAHALADMVRAGRHQVRAVAGDSEQAQAVKVVARAHQRLIWERHRHMLRLRTALREFFPAALAACHDLTAPEVLELLARAPDPASAARLSRSQITAALTRARRRQVQDKAAAIAAALRTEHLAQPAAAAYAATARSLATMITAFNAEITVMQEQVNACFGQARDAEIYQSQPGLGPILAARVLGESGEASTATPPPRTAKTTPAPARSPEPPARRKPSWPVTSTTTGSSMPCTSRRSAP
jgi:Transposase